MYTHSENFFFFGVSPNDTARIKCLIVNRTRNEFSPIRDLCSRLRRGVSSDLRVFVLIRTADPFDCMLDMSCLH